MVSRLITDYPELGYETLDEFVCDAIKELLYLKGLQVTQLQTWRKIGDT